MDAKSQACIRLDVSQMERSLICRFSFSSSYYLLPELRVLVIVSYRYRMIFSILVIIFKVSVIVGQPLSL